MQALWTKNSSTRPPPPPPRRRTIPHKPSPPLETQDSPRPLDSTAEARTTPRRRVGSGAVFRLSWWKGKRITRRRGLYIYGRPASTAFSLSYARRRFKYLSRRLAYTHQNLIDKHHQQQSFVGVKIFIILLTDFRNSSVRPVIVFFPSASATTAIYKVVRSTISSSRQTVSSVSATSNTFQFRTAETYAQEMWVYNIIIQSIFIIVKPRDSEIERIYRSTIGLGGWLWIRGVYF